MLLVRLEVFGDKYEECKRNEKDDVFHIILQPQDVPSFLSGSRYTKIR